MLRSSFCVRELLLALEVKGEVFVVVADVVVVVIESSVKFG